MPELGIFSRTFDRPTLAGVLDAISEHGFRLVHFNLRSAGMAALPESLTSDDCRAIRAEVEARGFRLAGVSATYNTIHPDPVRRECETQLASRVIALAPELGTSFVSLSTGTRDPENLWRSHPANGEPEAWGDLVETLGRLLSAALEAGVTLGIEPEQHNVVSSAKLARRLLDEIADPHLGIILDAANLLTTENVGRQDEVLAEAFDLLGREVSVFHAKDFTERGAVAAGRGLLDYRLYSSLIGALAARRGFEIPVILHEVAEDDVDRAKEFVLGSF